MESGASNALSLLRKNGWFKGSIYWHAPLHSGSNNHCLITALGAVHSTVKEFEVVADVCRTQYPDRIHRMTNDIAGCVMISVNNHPETTFDDVERILEKAAIALDEAV